jgi:hypothetical protein
VPPLFYPIWKRALYGAYETEMVLSNARLSILGIGDAPAFMIKGDTRAFMMGEEMRDMPAFVMKGDAPLATHFSFSFIIRDAH